MNRTALIALASLLGAAPLPAQTAAADAALLDRLAGSASRHAAGDVVVLAEPGTLTPAEADRFAETMARGVDAISALLGRGLDRERYGTDTLYVVISDAVTVSHVFGAYEHPAHPRPYLFLAPDRVRDGTAPYLHEATHLLAWRFGSLSLREGFASYVEARVSAALGISSPGLFGVADTLDADVRAARVLQTPSAAAVLPWIGRAGTPDAAVTSTADRRSRAAFYLLSQSFTQSLVRALGVDAFLEVYAAADPEAALLARTGRSREAWIDAWRTSLGPGR